GVARYGWVWDWRGGHRGWVSGRVIVRANRVQRVVTPTLWPERPEFTSGAEKVVWDALKGRLRDGDAMLHGLRLTDSEHGDVEIDVTLLLPDAGLIAVEVKGGRVRYANGQWKSFGVSGAHRIRPTEQARKGLYALRDYLTYHPRWSRGQLPVRWAVAFPYTRVVEDLAPDAPRSVVIGEGELDLAFDKLCALAQPRPKDPPIAKHWVESAFDLLAGRGTCARDQKGAYLERQHHVERLVAGQGRVLDMIADNRLIEVRGAAGSGKTWLAFEQARRWAESGKRVALLTYGRGITTYFGSLADGLPVQQRPAFIGTFHQLGVQLGVRAPTAAPSKWWEQDSPLLMAAAAKALPADERFDAVVVDEAQDFADDWWQAVTATVVDPNTATIAVLRDDNQAVFNRRGRPPGNFATVTLRDNLRSTRQIGEAMDAVLTTDQHLLGGEGPPVQFVTCDPEDVIATASDIAVGLLDDGWSPLDVALLTTKHRHPVQVEQQRLGQDAYWANFWDGSDMFYCTVAGFKGLERPAVVLAVDGFHDERDPREVLYTGMSRARDLLIVVRGE
ncbi:MAG: ATP-binding domain-containing protein, partial [Actinomycetes bacterium]